VGLKKGLGFAKLPCCSCMIVRNDLEKIHHESDCIMRNQITHEQQCTEIENAAIATRYILSVNYGMVWPISF
jgi:hypothetical protein